MNEQGNPRRYFVFCCVIVSFDGEATELTIALPALAHQSEALAARVLLSWTVDFDIDRTVVERVSRESGPDLQKTTPNNAIYMFAEVQECIRALCG